MIVGVCMSINHPSVLSEWFHPYDVESAKDGCDSGGVDQKNLHYVWGKRIKSCTKGKEFDRAYKQGVHKWGVIHSGSFVLNNIKKAVFNRKAKWGLVFL